MTVYACLHPLSTTVDRVSSLCHLLVRWGVVQMQRQHIWGVKLCCNVSWAALLADPRQVTALCCDL